MSNLTSFTQKIITVTMTVVEGVKPDPKNKVTTKVFSGLRVYCEIRKVGHPQKNGCRVKIYGMTQEDMTLCTIIPDEAKAFLPHPSFKQVFLYVDAGDENGMTNVFKGEIVEAFIMDRTPPNIFFHIEAATGHYPVLLPASPRGYRGATKAEDVIKDIAASIGYTFQNNGFSAMLSSPYLTGSAIEQIRQVVASVPMEIQIDDLGVYIAPLGYPRLQDGQVPYISAQTGMKGYPIFDKHGIRVECLFMPQLLHGGQFYLASDVQSASGYYMADTVHHRLESNAPNGQWLTRINGHLLHSKAPAASPIVDEGE